MSLKRTSTKLANQAIQQFLRARPFVQGKLAREAVAILVRYLSPALCFEKSLHARGLLHSQDYHVSGERSLISQYLGCRENPIALDVGANARSDTNLVLSRSEDARPFGCLFTI